MVQLLSSLPDFLAGDTAQAFLPQTLLAFLSQSFLCILCVMVEKKKKL